MPKKSPQKIVDSLKPHILAYSSPELSELYAHLEEIIVSEILQRTRGSLSEAARTLDISTHRLKVMMQKYGLDVDDFVPTLNQLSIEFDKEKAELERIFEENGRDVKKTAEALGFSDSYTRQKLCKYRIHHMSRSRLSVDPELDGLGEQPDGMELDDAFHSIGIQS